MASMRIHPKIAFNGTSIGVEATFKIQLGVQHTNEV